MTGLSALTGGHGTVAQPGSGRATCRRKTATSCRSTRISASFAASPGARSTSQPNTWTMKRQTRRMSTSAEPRPASQSDTPDSGTAHRRRRSRSASQSSIRAVHGARVSTTSARHRKTHGRDAGNATGIPRAGNSQLTSCPLEPYRYPQSGHRPDRTAPAGPGSRSSPASWATVAGSSIRSGAFLSCSCAHSSGAGTWAAGHGSLLRGYSAAAGAGRTASLAFCSSESGGAEWPISRMYSSRRCLYLCSRWSSVSVISRLAIGLPSRVDLDRVSVPGQGAAEAATRHCPLMRDIAPCKSTLRENGGMFAASLRRRPSSIHSGIAPRSAPAKPHNPAAWRASGSSSLPEIDGLSPSRYTGGVGITQTPLPGHDAAAIGIAAFVVVYAKASGRSQSTSK